MLFSEIYSAYFGAVAAIIKKAQEGELSQREITNIINEKAFSESFLAILPALKSGKWLVMDGNFHTPIKNPPQMPPTLLQKRWLKSLLSDPRIALSQINADGLDDVEPLYTSDDFVFFDQRADGDPFTDSNYIANFQTILAALREKRYIQIKYNNRHGQPQSGKFVPFRLEYSAKDDKFRMETERGGRGTYINLARIESCLLLEAYGNMRTPPKRRERSVSFTLIDARNALNRVMLNFSDCRKETVRCDDNTYLVKLWYEAQDETEILIRILSFGPMIRVIAPKSFIALIMNRLIMQEAIEN